MLKMALFDCAINEKCCSVDGGRGICPLFAGDLTAQESPPREFVIQGKKKNAYAQESARGRGWAQVELTDASSQLLCTCRNSFSGAPVTRRATRASGFQIFDQV